jgi:hypothetical protein
MNEHSTILIYLYALRLRNVYNQRPGWNHRQLSGLTTRDSESFRCNPVHLFPQKSSSLSIAWYNFNVHEGMRLHNAPSLFLRQVRNW